MKIGSSHIIPYFDVIRHDFLSKFSFNNLYYSKDSLAIITQQWQGINFESISDKYATSVYIDEFILS